MKSVLITLLELLDMHGMLVKEVHLKIGENGQVLYCAGKFSSKSPTLYVDGNVERVYKEMSEQDFRFNGSILDVDTENKSYIFTITRQCSSN